MLLCAINGDFFTEPIKIYATEFETNSCLSTLIPYGETSHTYYIDTKFDFVNMEYEELTNLLETTYIFGEKYDLSVKCADGEVYRLKSVQKYELTGTNAYYYGTYDNPTITETIIGTVTSTSELLSDNNLISVLFNGASEINGFNELVLFKMIQGDNISASIGICNELNPYEDGLFHYYLFDMNNTNIWLKLPIQKL